MALALLVGEDVGALAEQLRRIAAVDGDGDVAGRRAAGELDFEVELRARQDLGAPQRIDRRLRRQRLGQQQRCRCREAEPYARHGRHELTPKIVPRPAKPSGASMTAQ